MTRKQPLIDALPSIRVSPQDRCFLEGLAEEQDSSISRIVRGLIRQAQQEYLKAKAAA